MSSVKEKMSGLRAVLLAQTKAGQLWQPEANGAIRCLACGHRCPIPEGRDGVCKVRANLNGELRVPWGYVGGLHADPIEKKPFFHVTPGAFATSFGMLGCDLHCAYCQNWVTSQSLRDPNASIRSIPITPSDICNYAAENGSTVLTSTYNEPLITAEWAVEIFKEGKRRGFKTSFVSNGNATPEVLEFIRPFVDYYKVDLKSFSDAHYRQLGAVLANILDSIRLIYEMGFWLEIVTLLIPGFNDSDDEIKRLVEFIASISVDIPWHATAFHSDYKMADIPSTTVDTLLRAAELATQAGLKFIYLGNRPGQVGKWENTFCPHCQTELVTRLGFRVLENRLQHGACPDCNKTVPGIW